MPSFCFSIFLLRKSNYISFFTYFLCALLTGDVTERLCTAAEMKFYFDSLFDNVTTVDTGTKKANFLKPNKNCNLTSWVAGCEPGWTCSVGSDQKVDLRNSKEIPSRTLDCQPCCAGFFCPQGLTCMIGKDMITTLFILCNH